VGLLEAMKPPTEYKPQRVRVGEAKKEVLERQAAQGELLPDYSPDRIAEIRTLARDDFYFFCSYVLGNSQVLDFPFHSLVCRFAEHGVSRHLPVGDYYFPTREALVEANGELIEKYRLGDPTEPAKKRLSSPPTALDGAFRGVFIRIKGEGKEKISLTFRGSLKTTVNTIAREVWMLTREPELTFFNCMNSKENVKKVVRGMKTHFLSNPLFRTVYRDIIPPHMVERRAQKAEERSRYVDQADQFDVHVPDDLNVSNKTRRECSVTGLSVGARAVSLHFPEFNFDDIVDDKCVKTVEGTMNNVQAWQEYQSLAIGDITRQFYTGTPWDDSDTSQEVLYSPGLEDQSIMIATVVGTDDEPIYPQNPDVKRHPGYTKSRVRQLKKSQKKGWLFDAQYMIQPVSKDRQVFKPESWRWYDPEKFEVQPQDKTLISLDPAVSEQKQGDWSGFFCITINHRGEWYIREAIRHRSLGEGATIETLKQMTIRWSATTLAIEGIAFQKTYQYIIEDLIRRGEFPNVAVERVEPSRQQSKEWRIKKISPRVQAGLVFLPVADKSLPFDTEHQRYASPEGIQRLILEGARFPKIGNEDMLDALAQVLELQWIPEAPAEPEQDKTWVQVYEERIASRAGTLTEDGVEYVDEVLGTCW
jgi:phage terminase large subunit-like protein